MRKPTGLLVIVMLGMTILSFGQQKLNLATALQEQQIKAVNRTLSLYENQPGAVEMNAAEGDGLAVLKEIAFESGTIEVERLTSSKSDKIGLWVGNGSSGRFRNLTIH